MCLRSTGYPSLASPPAHHRFSEPAGGPVARDQPCVGTGGRLTWPARHAREEKEGEVLTARAGPRVQVVQLVIGEGVVVPGALQVHGPLKVLTAPALSLGRADTGPGLSTEASSPDTPRGTEGHGGAASGVASRWAERAGPDSHFLPTQGPGKQPVLLTATTEDPPLPCPLIRTAGRREQV